MGSEMCIRDSSNNNSAHGGSVSFGLSTTTDSGMTVSSGAGITLSASSAAAAKAISGFQNITFATGGTSITLGNDVGLPDGVGDVGGAVGSAASSAAPPRRAEHHRKGAKP